MSEQKTSNKALLIVALLTLAGCSNAERENEILVGIARKCATANGAVTLVAGKSQWNMWFTLTCELPNGVWTEELEQ
jgi:hypothetical protein